jgi:hypothetical protein
LLVFAICSVRGRSALVGLMLAGFTALYLSDQGWRGYRDPLQMDRLVVLGAIPP